MKKMLPQNPGRFRVQTAMAGNYIVIFVKNSIQATIMAKSGFKLGRQLLHPQPHDLSERTL
jgi:hypothetical protein